MNKDPIRTNRRGRTAVLAGVLSAGALLALNPGAAGPAYAAERMVLCEEDTNLN